MPLTRSLRSTLRDWESRPLGRTWPLTLAAIIVVRALLEYALESEHSWSTFTEPRLALTDWAHVLVSWSTLFLLGTVVLAAARGTRLALAATASLRLFPLICIVPLVDSLAGTGGPITYQHDFSTFAASFRDLFVPTRAVAFVTPGVRLEIFVLCLCAGTYTALLAENARVLRTAGAALGLYATPFVVGFLPAGWNLLLGSTHAQRLAQSVLQVNTPEALLLLYLPIALPLGAALLLALHPTLKALLADALRPARLFIYLVLLAAGFVHAAQRDVVGWDWMNPYDLGELLLAHAALGLAFLSQVLVNDIHDLEIDRRSNSARPLPRGLARRDDYALLAALSAALALLLGSIVDAAAPYPLLGLLALGWLYSAPPLRLRRFPGLAHALLAAIGVGSYLLGATLIQGNLAIRSASPSTLLTLGALFFAAAHFKDLKDVAGDRTAGCHSLATWFGPDRAYWIAGSLVLLVLALGFGLGSIPLRVIPALASICFLFAWLVLRNGERLLAWCGVLLCGILWG